MTEEIATGSCANLTWLSGLQLNMAGHRTGRRMKVELEKMLHWLICTQLMQRALRCWYNKPFASFSDVNVS